MSQVFLQTFVLVLGTLFPAREPTIEPSPSALAGFALNFRICVELISCRKFCITCVLEGKDSGSGLESKLTYGRLVTVAVVPR